VHLKEFLMSLMIALFVFHIFFGNSWENLEYEFLDEGCVE
jgi:hypothetical protein